MGSSMCYPLLPSVQFLSQILPSYSDVKANSIERDFSQWNLRFPKDQNPKVEERNYDANPSPGLEQGFSVSEFLSFWAG